MYASQHHGLQTHIQHNNELYKKTSLDLAPVMSEDEVLDAYWSSLLTFQDLFSPNLNRAQAKQTPQHQNNTALHFVTKCNFTQCSSRLS